MSEKLTGRNGMTTGSVSLLIKIHCSAGIMVAIHALKMSGVTVRRVTTDSINDANTPFTPEDVVYFGNSRYNPVNTITDTQAATR